VIRRAQKLLSLQVVRVGVLLAREDGLHIRLMVGFLVLNCPRVAMVANAVELVCAGRMQRLAAAKEHE
jgi:hypothetical protein